ncbi:Imm64 family immunity protein [Aneurinibacillus sp. REN35]|uniref:Imm64 family immunity protein n=1 Tax=Aneurinibacillus sp. REN35 TaxID=3237286 RepID=UPI00352713EA
MSAYITTGFVYDTHVAMDKQAKKLLLYIKEQGRLLSAVDEVFYSEIHFASFQLDEISIPAVLRFEKEADYKGIIWDCEEGVFAQAGLQNAAQIEQWIETLVQNAAQRLTFAYAFADQEAEIEHSPAAFAALEDSPYALTFARQTDNHIIIRKNTWRVDGMSAR